MAEAADWKNKDVLEELYIERGLSLSQIASRLGCTKPNVHYYCKKYNIPTRDAHKPFTEELADKQKMREYYVEKSLSTNEIADLLGCSRPTVRKWLRRHNIEIRPQHFIGEGEDHPSWNGGQEPYGRGWSESKKESVRERDARRCRFCGLEEIKHKRKFGEKLHVHHVIPARKFEDPERRNSMENLVTLCKSCHMKWEGIPLVPPEPR